MEHIYVNYIGPMARAQKMQQAEEIMNYLFVRSQWLGAVPPEVIQANPAVLYKINYDKVDEFISHAMGVDNLDIYNGDEEVNRQVQELRQAQQAQQAVALSQQGAGAVKDLATAEKMARGG